MTHLTQADTFAAFSRLCHELGQERGQATRQTGIWKLDSNHVYGGHVIRQILNSAGAETTPVFPQRLGTREFVNACEFAISILRYYKEKRT